MTGSEQPSIVCCLSAGDYRRRLAWIGSLARKALRSHDRDDLVLYLAYAPEAAGEVQKMVEQERMCCAFLTFDLHEQADTVCLTITAPEAARESADVLFGQFLPGDGTPKYGSVSA